MNNFCPTEHFHVVPDLDSVLKILKAESTELKAIKRYVDADCLVLEQSTNIYYELDNYIEYLIQKSYVQKHNLNRQQYIDQINSIVRINSFGESFGEEVNEIYGILSQEGIFYKEIYNFVLARHSGANILLTKNSKKIESVIKRIFPKDNNNLQIHNLNSLFEFITNTSVSAKTISVLTRDDEVIDLPVNSTPIDFAYKIHTDLGHQSIGAIVNGEQAELDQDLKSGDKVEIIKGKILHPKKEWLSFAVTHLVHKNVSGWHRNRAISKAKSELEREFGKNFFYGKKFRYIAQRLNKSDISDFFEAFGLGEIGIDEIESKASEYAQKNINISESKIEFESKPPIVVKESDSQDIPKCSFSLSKCCLPLPNDSIFGCIDQMNNALIRVHRTSCRHAPKISANKKINLTWNTSQCLLITQVVVKDREKILLFVADRLSNINIRFDIRSINPIKNDVDINKRTSKWIVHFLISDRNQLDIVLNNLVQSSNSIRRIQVAKMKPGIKDFGLDW